MVKSRNPINRRDFLRWTSALAFPAILPASVLGKDGSTNPSERIAVGVIGLGSRGFNLIDDLLRAKEAQIVAICDVDLLHYRDNPWGKGSAYGREAAQIKIDGHYQSSGGVSVESDFREVCSRDDLDAIVVATPDHWHALITLEALRNRKDVYCEKPLTHTFLEGQQVYREVQKQKAVFQTGSQQRSDKRFRRAVELVRNGRLGPINRIEVGLPAGYDHPMGAATATTPPPHLDYDFWCGPSPVLPYMRARHHRWWRGHTAYGGGVLMDWIGHHNDIAHWALDLDDSGPIRVEAVNWTYPETEIYDTPSQYEIQCEYSGGTHSSISSQNQLGTKFIGEDGWIFVNRQTLEASDPSWCDEGFDSGPKKAYRSLNHMRNFLDCVRSREECIAPAETGHRSVTPGHLGYVSHRLGRALKWDPEAEKVIDDDAANNLLHHQDYREPWA
ncbi:MAG: Gfo/Idh/MocA family oxidoreductase [Candidatus Omnitrophica bacterium]|nr:Gfo/Idh/MocA family oxidoreductase [Candidatus Omnitrophota bacterium]